MSKIYLDGDELSTDPSNIKTNPLAQFKSYSYYHVLAVCDTTLTAEALADSSGEDLHLWKHPYTSDDPSISSDDQQYWEMMKWYTPKTIDTEDGAGRYCVLINGATDAAVSITKVSLQTITAAGAVNNDRFNSLATEGSIELSEPRGITFLDTIVRCCTALGKDASHVTYVLKTYFVGYSAQSGQSDEIITISDVPPIRFLVTDATGSFTEAGGEYTIQFVSMNNGGSRLPQFDKTVHGTDIQGVLLKDVVQSIQASISKQYDTLYNCVRKQVEAVDAELVSKLRRVEYKIELHPLYQSDIYVFGSGAEQGKTKPGCDTKGQINTGTDYSIESALQQMMQHCPRVDEDATKGLDASVAPQTCGTKPIKASTPLTYRIHTYIDSTPASNQKGGDPTKPTYTVTYRIEPFPTPKGLMTQDEDTIKTVVNPNTLYFDYMYTGRNIDILEFDMKLNMGYAYLQIATLTNSHKSQNEPLPATITMPVIKNIKRAQTRTKTLEPSSTANEHDIDIPVFFSTNMDLPTRKTTHDPAPTSSAAYDMSTHASLEALNANVKITGNVLLLNSAMPKTRKSRENPTSSSSTALMDWGNIPAYAKINIRMPANNDDLGLFHQDYKDTDFTKQFWYDGYYYIIGVEHVFSDGEFVQNLQLLSMPQPIPTGDSAAAEKSAKEQKAEFSKKVVDCFTGTTSCPPSAASGSNTTPANTAVQRSPTVKREKTKPIPYVPPSEMDKLVSTMSASNVKGWDRASINYKTPIEQAVSRQPNKNIPLSTYAAIAAIESNGNIGARSRTGAAGIFQFTQTTWTDKHVMPDHPITRSNDPRMDPNLNAEAATKYMAYIAKRVGTTDPTWLYMGHNLGPGAAALVKSREAAGTNVSMADLYQQKNICLTSTGPCGAAAWYSFAKNNGYNANSTTMDIRSQVAGKFVKRLVDPQGIKPAAQQPAAQQPAAQQPAAQQLQPPSPQPQANEAVGAVTPPCDTTGSGSPDKKEQDTDNCGSRKVDPKDTQSISTGNKR